MGRRRYLGLPGHGGQQSRQGRHYRQRIHVPLCMQTTSLESPLEMKKPIFLFLLVISLLQINNCVSVQFNPKPELLELLLLFLDLAIFKYPFLK